MINVTRYEGNPILAANAGNTWEAEGVFNGCPVRDGDTTYLLYRAQSAPAPHLGGPVMSLSSIGIAKSSDGGPRRDKPLLSDREKQIVQLVAQGYRNKEIGEKLFISEQTVKNHLHNIFDKLGVSDRLELALYAIHHRLIDQA